MGRSSKAYVQCTRAINRAIKLEEAARKGSLAIAEEEESVVQPTKQLQVVKKVVDRQFEDDFSSSDSDESTFQLQYELHICCEAVI